MSELKDLYQEVILDHTRNPRNKGKLENPTHHAEGYNPLCGDQISIEILMENELISDIKFEGSGCAISTSSASMLSEHLIGKTMEEAQNIFQDFHQLVTRETPGKTETLGKLVIFEGVREFPTRVKCATLSWHTLLAALENKKEAVSTE